jgi:hypothetical protein
MTTPNPPEDPRDPRTAEWLEVEPLDELTRARLVRTALTRSADTAHPVSRRSRRTLTAALAVAAALLVVVVGGVALLRPGSGEDSSPTAARAPSAPSAKGATPSAPSRAGDSSAMAEADAVPAPLRSLGPLGDVSSPARLRAAASRSLAAPATATVVPSECAVAAGRALGTPIAAGTASVDGQAATVVVARRPDGRRVAIAVVDGSCDRGPSVRLS